MYLDLCLKSLKTLCLEEEEEEEAKNFKGAIVKFHRLFNLPPEEKLVNCKSKHIYTVYNIVNVLIFNKTKIHRKYYDNNNIVIL